MLVFMLVLLAVVAGDKLTYLSFLDAKFVATMFMVVGVIGFIVKLIYWKLSNKAGTKTN